TSLFSTIYPSTCQTYPLSLPDALPIFGRPLWQGAELGDYGVTHQVEDGRRQGPHRPLLPSPKVENLPLEARHGSRSDESLGEIRSEEHTSELQSLTNLVCRLLLEQKTT